MDFCFVCNWIWKNSVELLLLLMLFSNRCCLLFFSCLHFEFFWQFYIYSLEYYSYSYIIRLRLRWFLVVLFTFWCCCCSCVYFWAICLENVFDILTLVELSQQLVLWLVLQGHQGVGCQGLVSQVETVARWVSEDGNESREMSLRLSKYYPQECRAFYAQGTHLRSISCMRFRWSFQAFSAS